MLISDAESARSARELVLSLAGRSESLRSLVESPQSRLFACGGLFVGHLHPESAGTPGDLRAAGVTSWTLAAFGRSAGEIRCRAEAAASSPLAGEPGFQGLYVEGPFITGGDCGSAAAGALGKIVDGLPAAVWTVVFAPECPGAGEFADELSMRGIEGVLGYTEAGYDLCVEAFSKGARGVCLPFVSTAPPHHRRPGVLVAAATAGAWVEVPVGPAAFTRQEARFLAKAFGRRLRPVYHPGVHDDAFAGRPFPMDFASRAAAMLGLSAREFIALYADAAPASEGTVVLFDESLAVAATLVCGEVAFAAWDV